VAVDWASVYQVVDLKASAAAKLTAAVRALRENSWQGELVA
jgi:hypothetical protein